MTSDVTRQDMSRLCGEAHRALQDRFDTRALADRLEDVAMTTTIESRDLFFKGPVAVAYETAAAPRVDALGQISQDAWIDRLKRGDSAAYNPSRH